MALLIFGQITNKINEVIMKKNGLKLIIFSVLTLVVVGIVILLIVNNSAKIKPMIRVGQIEMKEIDVASKVPGRVSEIKVDEGDVVLIGQELFRLSDRELQAKAGQAQGSIESAMAQYSMANAGARPEQIEMAERSYLAAKSQFELAEKTHSRMAKMHNEKLISDQEFDAIEQKYKAAEQAMQAANAQFIMAKKGSRTEEKLMAKGQLEKARMAKEEVNSYLDETIISAQMGGIIAKKYIDAGEIVAPGFPVLSIIDTTDAWAELNLPANELEKIKIGMEIQGKIHGLGIIETFKVVSFSAMADYANWRTTIDKATYDVRTFTVKLKPINSKISSLRPGMTVSFDLNNLNK